MAIAGLEISLLGPPRVQRAGELVSFDTRKATALLAHLALAERPRSRDSLCELLWPGRDPEHARGALRRTLSALRKAIGEEWVDAAADSVALRDGPGLELDVRRFRSLTSEAASPTDLAAAVELFRGELLEGFGLRDSPEFDAWQVYEAETLRRELSAALARLVRRSPRAASYARAIPYARRWLELDPLHEPAHRALIRLYALAGDRAAALAQYRACVRTLSQELGVPPVEETAALFERVSEGTLSRRVPEPPPVGRPPARAIGAAARGARCRARVAARGSPRGRARRAPGGDRRRGGDRQEPPRARADWECPRGRHRAGHALPRGRSGPAIRANRRAARGGAALATAALSDGGPAQRLADASLLLPELGSLRAELPPPVSLSAPGARARLLEGIAAVLGAACRGAKPGLVFVDDVHAADEATLDVLGYLGRRLHGRPLMLAVSWRSEGVPPGHRLRRLATELSRGGAATVVDLGRLDEDEVATLVREARPDARPELERRVFIESEGLPLFVAEYLAALGAGDDAAPARSPPRCAPCWAPASETCQLWRARCWRRPP